MPIQNQKYAKNASDFHKTIGRLLNKIPQFNLFNILQEYPSYKLNSSITNKRLKYDWFIKDLKLIIECQGEQHYKPIVFGKEEHVDNNFRALTQLVKQKRYDDLKKRAAIGAGYSYLEIQREELASLTPELLYNRIIEAIDKRVEIDDWISQREPDPAERKKRVKRALTDAQKKKKEEQKQKAKEYRKKQYKNFKEWKKNYGR